MIECECKQCEKQRSIKKQLDLAVRILFELPQFKIMSHLDLRCYLENQVIDNELSPLQGLEIRAHWLESDANKKKEEL